MRKPYGGDREIRHPRYPVAEDRADQRTGLPGVRDTIGIHRQADRACENTGHLCGILRGSAPRSGKCAEPERDKRRGRQCCDGVLTDGRDRAREGASTDELCFCGGGLRDNRACIHAFDRGGAEKRLAQYPHPDRAQDHAKSS